MMGRIQEANRAGIEINSDVSFADWRTPFFCSGTTDGLASMATPRR